MSRGFRISLFALLALSALFFGWHFKQAHELIEEQRASRRDTELIDVPLPKTAESMPAASSAPKTRLGWWGAGLVLSLVGAGGLLAFEVAQFLGTRAGRAYFDETQQGPADPDYEQAEEAWTRGDFLEAIRLLREYLAAKPREQHVALRIAEIYEKDLRNYLAAALEYEEVLKQRLPPERWGWAAIHLCNLYTGKLDQLDKAIELLQRIDRDYGQTAAAEKARARLKQLEAEGIIAAAPPAPSSPTDTGPSLPPGFGPRKS
jgi:tetratricopeptide (TPR) repeat protein